MACLQSRSFCNEILVEALPCLQPWFSSKVTNLAVGSQAQYLPSLTLSFPICKMYWPVCLPVFTWLLNSINEMSVKCMAQKGGSTKDDDYHGPNFTKFSEVLRQGLGAEEGRDPVATWQMGLSPSSCQDQEPSPTWGPTLAPRFLGEQSGLGNRGQTLPLIPVSLFLPQSPRTRVEASFHAPLYLISRTMTRFGDLRAQMDCLLASVVLDSFPRDEHWAGFQELNLPSDPLLSSPHPQAPF